MQKTKRKSISEKSERVVTCEEKEEFNRERETIKTVPLHQRMVLSIKSIPFLVVFQTLVCLILIPPIMRE